VSWVSIILGLLKLANVIFQWAQEQKWINEGEAKAIAKSSAEILRKTNYAKQALEDATAKSDSELDEFLRDLEPEPPDRK
jgi:Zn-dependent oligopeptidase